MISRIPTQKSWGTLRVPWKHRQRFCLLWRLFCQTWRLRKMLQLGSAFPMLWGEFRVVFSSFSRQHSNLMLQWKETSILASLSWWNFPLARKFHVKSDFWVFQSFKIWPTRNLVFFLSICEWSLQVISCRKEFFVLLEWTWKSLLIFPETEMLA